MLSVKTRSGRWLDWHVDSRENTKAITQAVLEDEVEKVQADGHELSAINAMFPGFAIVGPRVCTWFGEAATTIAGNLV